MKILNPKVISSSIFLFLFTLASTAFAAPPWATIRGMSHAGSGCPAGTVAQNLAPDLKAFTLLFDSYIAEAGPGISFAQSRKNCQILLDMNFPQGWSFSIFKVDYRGYANLDRRVTGIQKSTYYFQGQRLGPSFQTSLRGPFDNDYSRRDTLGVSALVWSPCGAQRALNINTQVRINNRRNRGGQGLMTLDSIDGQVKHIYGIRWRRCR